MLWPEQKHDAELSKAHPGRQRDCEAWISWACDDPIAKIPPALHARLNSYDASRPLKGGFFRELK